MGMVAVFRRVAMETRRVLLAALVIAASTSARSTRKDDVSAKIVNGYEAKTAEIPYQVLLQMHGMTGSSICGGAVIHKYFVLTATHCVFQQASILVTAGAVDRFAYQPITREVVKTIYYPKSDNDNIENDIALLQVDRPFPITNEVNLVPLRETFPKDETNCTVSGWGDAADFKEISTLNVIHIPILPRDVCEKSYPMIQLDRFCAGFIEGEKDTCIGDSGGPLVCDGLLTGVVEGGEGCALPGKPGTYTDVTYYRKWIESVLDKFARQHHLGTSEPPTVINNTDVVEDVPPPHYGCKPPRKTKTPGSRTQGSINTSWSTFWNITSTIEQRDKKNKKVPKQKQLVN